MDAISGNEIIECVCVCIRNAVVNGCIVRNWVKVSKVKANIGELTGYVIASQFHKIPS